VVDHAYIADGPGRGRLEKVGAVVVVSAPGAAEPRRGAVL